MYNYGNDIFNGNDSSSINYSPNHCPFYDDKKEEAPTNAQTIEKKEKTNKNKEIEIDNKSSNGQITTNNFEITNGIKGKEEKEFLNIEINTSGLCTKENIVEIFDRENYTKFKEKMEENKISSEFLISNHLKKKTRRKGKSKKEEEKGEQNRRGRKKKDDYIKQGCHNKFSTDNIIRKIKKNFKEYIVSSNKKYLGNELKYLNYNELVSKGDKKANLDLLDMPLREFLSQDISGKYTTEKADTNRKYINKILEEKKNDKTLKYVLNITFRDWIEIFTMKRKSDVQFEGIDELLEKILNDKDNKDDNNYFCNFVFCLYNYEKYWESKRDRKSNKTA